MNEPTHRPLVLYVHDGEGDDDQVCKILRAAGHRILESNSGAKAIACVQLSKLDVIVLDLALNDMSIAELIRELRSQPGGQSAALLSITDRKDRPRAFSGLEHGADAYLLRPIDSRGLLAQVDALLRMRNAEQQARRFAREWRIAFDAITDAILVLSASGEVMRCNCAALRLLGRPREQVIGRKYRQLFNATQNLPDNLTTTATPLLTEIALGERWYRLAVDPVAEDDEPCTGEVVVVLTDLTEVKRYEKDLRRHAGDLELHNQRQIEFLRLLSHELRNPLAAISAAASTLAETGGQTPRTSATVGERAQRSDDSAAHKDSEQADHREHDELAPLEVIQRQVGHLTRMVGALLDVSRISAGKIELQLAPCDLREVCRSAAAAIQRAARDAGHRLEVELGPHPVIADVDATRCEQVLTNLLDNSIKYTPRGGTIALRLAPAPQPPQFAQITVSDTGVGLPDKAAFEDAFEMFVQYERTLARAQGGLGIGLSLARTLIEMHGGNIQADPGDNGTGTVMTISLPRVPASRWSSEQQTLKMNETTPYLDRTQSRKVLLVEDNDDLRQLVALRLKRAGHEVLQASNGPEGLRTAIAAPPDVFVLDIGLPEMNGYELAKALRAQEPLQDCLMIALTGYGSTEAREAAMDAGFDAHLVKPIDMNKLQALIEGRTQSAQKH